MSIAHLPSQLAEALTPANRNDIIGWWNSLAAQHRRSVYRLLEPENESCHYTRSEASEWQTLPIAVGDPKTIDPSMEDGFIEQEAYDYYLKISEFQPTEPKFFFIIGCHQQASAQWLLRHRLITAQFRCSGQQSSCIFRGMITSLKLAVGAILDITPRGWAIIHYHSHVAAGHSGPSS